MFSALTKNLSKGALSIDLSANKNKWLLSHHGINSSYLSPDQLKNAYGLSPKFLPGGGAFYYEVDGHLKYDFWTKLETGIKKIKGVMYV